MGTSLIWSSRVLTGTAAAMLLGSALVGPTAATLPPPTPVASTPAATHASAPEAALAAHRVRIGIPAQGSITVRLDPATLTATPTGRGTQCLLRVAAALELAGTVTGTATGVTAATINAPCPKATTNPPGTFSDTFRFTGDFRGAVAGNPAAATVEYAGVTRVGGAVSAVLVLHGDATVVSAVQATVGGTGTYRGTVLQ